MGKDHLKRIATPKTWPIARKANTFVMRPQSGKLMELSLPLGFVLKEVLEVAQTSKQVTAMLQAGRVVVDGVARKDKRYAVGLYDVIELVEAKKAYRIGIKENGKLMTVEIDVKEAGLKLLQLTRKTLVKGGKMQVAFLNGRTVLVDDAKAYSVGDTIVMDAKGGIKKQLPFAKGSFVQLVGGRHIGVCGTIKDITGTKIIVEAQGSEFETLKKYAFVVGLKESEVQVQ